jgi:hypothetical protein
MDELRLNFAKKHQVEWEVPQTMELSQEEWEDLVKLTDGEWD